jgi:prepilin-type N-terminal cleavage/methylation domain-containing protein
MLSSSPVMAILSGMSLAEPDSLQHMRGTMTRVQSFNKKTGAQFRRGNASGFSMVELAVVMLIILVLAAIAVPKVLTMIHTVKLRGVGSDFSGVVQAARLRAIQDDRFYSVYILNGTAFADIYPQSNTGASGTAGASFTTCAAAGFPCDPQAALSSEITPTAAASAPNTSNLSGQFLPSGSALTVHDGLTNTTPITFGPRGLPCTSQTVTVGASSGTVCDSSGGATAYWVFFQDAISTNWEAVTVSPAGRIAKWYYNGSTWQPI